MAILKGGILVLVFSSAFRAAELKMPQQEFGMPMDFPMDLSGNFAQLRSSHFHAGLDIRTKQTIGHKVYSVADGYVSRIGVNIYGYGKVVYITHPSGKTTLYAHLDNFAPKLAKRVEEAWETQKKYEVDIQFNSWEIPVFRGEQIGLSGNTGGSGGPHLHFEVRDTKTGENLNPLKQGYKLADSKKPVFTGLKLYSLEEGGTVNGQNNQAEIPILGTDGNFKSKIPTLPVSGVVGIGINAYDPQDLNNFKMGLYFLSMRVDNQEVYAYKHDRFSYEEGRRIVLHCDYEDKISNNNAIEKLWVLPGNDSRFYIKGPGSGVIKTEPGKTYFIVITASDINGNTSKLEFSLLGVAKQKPFQSKIPGKTFSFLADYTDSIFGGNYKIKFPKDGLYDDLFLPSEINSHTESDELATCHIGNSKQFLKSEAEIQLKVPQIPSALLSQLYILHEGKKNLFGELKGGYYHFKYHRLGRFALMADTVKPDISPLDISAEGILEKYSGVLRFKTSDIHTGIASWEAYINDEFQLLEYEYKENLLFTRNPKIKPGPNTLRLIVKDAVGNTVELNIVFTL